MSDTTKGVLLGIIIGIIALCIAYLIGLGKHNFAVFIAQSIVDNAIFCVMFLAVVCITGISC